MILDIFFDKKRSFNFNLNPVTFSPRPYSSCASSISIKTKFLSYCCIPKLNIEETSNLFILGTIPIIVEFALGITNVILSPTAKSIFLARSIPIDIWYGLTPILSKLPSIIFSAKLVTFFSYSGIIPFT